MVDVQQLWRRRRQHERDVRPGALLHAGDRQHLRRVELLGLRREGRLVKLLGDRRKRWLVELLGHRRERWLVELLGHRRRATGGSWSSNCGDDDSTSGTSSGKGHCSTQATGTTSGASNASWTKQSAWRHSHHCGYKGREHQQGADDDDNTTTTTTNSGGSTGANGSGASAGTGSNSTASTTTGSTGGATTTTPSKFDQTFLTLLAAAHREDIAEFAETAQETTNPAVRQYACEQLPILIAHLTAIQTAMGQVGVVDDTAQASAAAGDDSAAEPTPTAPPAVCSA